MKQSSMVGVLVLLSCGPMSGVDAGGVDGGASSSADAGAADASVIDGGQGDAGAPDGGLSSLRPGDELLVTPGSLTLVPGTRQCLSLQLLHSDGTQEPIDARLAQLTVVNAALVEATRSTECTGLGVMALAVGDSLVRVTVSDGAQVVQRSVPVSVQAGQLTVGTLSAVFAGVGDVTQVWFAVDARSASGSRLPEGVAPSLERVEATVANAAIAQVVRSPFTQRFGVRGLSVGSTALNVRYVYGAQQVEAAASQVTVFAQQPVSSVSVVPLDEAGVPQAIGRWSPNVCHQVALIAQHGQGAGSYSTIESPTTVTALSNESQVATDGSLGVCVGRHGEARVEACRQAQCAVLALPFFADADLQSFTSTAATALTLPSGPAHDECLPIVAQVQFVDGVTRDVFADWSTNLAPLISVTPWVTFTRQRQGHTPVQSSQGYPCFQVSAVPIGTRRTERLGITWAGKSPAQSPEVAIGP